MPDAGVASDFPCLLNGLHPNINFTMEFPTDGAISFIGMKIKKDGNKLQTQVYRKPTNAGLLLPNQANELYKHCLLRTMLHLAQALSSTRAAFIEE